MSKKDYILLAQALKDSKPENLLSVQTTNDMKIGITMFLRTCENIANKLAQDNPRFNRAKFLTACGYND